MNREARRRLLLIAAVILLPAAMILMPAGRWWHLQNVQRAGILCLDFGLMCLGGASILRMVATPKATERRRVKRFLLVAAVALLVVAAALAIDLMRQWAWIDVMR